MEVLSFHDLSLFGVLSLICILVWACLVLTKKAKPLHLGIYVFAHCFMYLDDAHLFVLGFTILAVSILVFFLRLVQRKEATIHFNNFYYLYLLLCGLLIVIMLLLWLFSRFPA